ncbi:MAG: PAS domain-containing sensor histidine kinase [Actinomycetota bacterium]|nr:PAS domain-containing sensor histidine kinase [Actinomycetota bacterium]
MADLSRLAHDDAPVAVCRAAADLLGVDAAVVALDIGTGPDPADLVVVHGEGGLAACIGRRFGVDGLEALVRPGSATTIVEVGDGPLTDDGPVTLVAARDGSGTTGVLALRCPRPSGEAADVASMLAARLGGALSSARGMAAVARSEAREQAVLDAIADGVAVIDQRGRVVAWNRAAENLTGLGAASAIGRPMPFESGTVDEPVEHDLGDDCWVEVVAQPLGEDGRVVVLRNISRQKALDAARTMFFAATSHELKTPLTVIRSFAEWLADQEGPVDAERYGMAVRAIADGAGELNQLVEKILLSARSEAGRLDLHLQPIDLRGLAREVAHRFDVPGRHDVALELPDEVARAQGDVQAVRTVLGQLMENAVKYSPDGGTITLGISAGDDGVTVRVTDEGIGLQPGEGEYLFVPFYQGETRSTRHIKGGVGLGLSIVRRLIEAMGGTVGADGVPNEGSTFWFTLPFEQDDSDLA